MKFADWSGKGVVLGVMLCVTLGVCTRLKRLHHAKHHAKHHIFGQTEGVLTKLEDPSNVNHPPGPFLTDVQACSYNFGVRDPHLANDPSVPPPERIKNYNRLKAGGHSFAIYTYNFGNFRGEMTDPRLVSLLNSFRAFGMDLYIYTDVPAELSHLKGWEVVYFPVMKDVNTVPGLRVTCKKLKWQPPIELLHYTYLIHTDSSFHSLAILNRWLHHGWLQKKLLDHPNIELFIRHHECRTKTSAEIESIKLYSEEQHMQNQAALAKFETYTKKAGNWSALESVPLPWTNLFVRKLGSDGLKKCLEKVYEMGMENGLWRDQLVIAYVLSVHCKQYLPSSIPMVNFPTTATVGNVLGQYVEFLPSRWHGDDRLMKSYNTSWYNGEQ
jgi:hypothetical protein